jgi:hypothetical protein
MPAPIMEIWVLTFLLAFPDSFVGGEYQSHGRCEAAAQHQIHHWRIVYGPHIRYKCEVQTMRAEGR